MVFGDKKFHQYFYIVGRSNYIPIINPCWDILTKIKISEISSTRIQRWAVILAEYTYHSVYCGYKQNGNANGLSL